MVELGHFRFEPGLDWAGEDYGRISGKNWVNAYQFAEFGTLKIGPRWWLVDGGVLLSAVEF